MFPFGPAPTSSLGWEVTWLGSALRAAGPSMDWMWCLLLALLSLTLGSHLFPMDTGEPWVGLFQQSQRGAICSADASQPEDMAPLQGTFASQSLLARQSGRGQVQGLIEEHS